MPCDEIILNNIEIKAANLDLLTKALEYLIDQGKAPRYWDGGYRAREQAEQIIKRGFVRLPAGQEQLADLIKQEYSRQAIQAAARKFNWRLQEKPGAGNKMTATKRV